MLVNKDNGGKTIGWRETYFGSNKTVNVSVVRKHHHDLDAGQDDREGGIKDLFGHTTSALQSF